MEITDPSRLLVRWCLRIAEFNFVVKYKKDKHSCFADFLSKMRNFHHTTEDIDEKIPSYAISSGQSRITTR